MGMFDEVRCNHEMFGADRGTVLQTKDTDWPAMEMYEITPEGRFVYLEYNTEDRGDKSAPRGSLDRVAGCMTPVYTGTATDQNFHGYLHLGSGRVRAKFTDGQLVAVERREGQAGE